MGTIVSFHAHPDDEAICTAGTLARAADAGHRVVLVFATRELGGFLPAQPTYLRFSNRFIRKWGVGGVSGVESYLAADADTLTAALILILIDCGWNVST